MSFNVSLVWQKKCCVNSNSAVSQQLKDINFIFPSLLENFSVKSFNFSFYIFVVGKINKFLTKVNKLQEIRQNE